MWAGIKEYCGDEEEKDEEDIGEEEEKEVEEEKEYKYEGTDRQTLLLMDSHVKIIKAKLIEEEIGGRLFTGQFNCSNRVYNSGPCPNALKPGQNLQAQLPKLLKKRPYTHLIVQSSCNDITNQMGIADIDLLFQMAKKSLETTVNCAVSAFTICPTLRSVLILPRSPRADNVVASDVSEYGNDSLVPAIFQTGHSNIKLGSMKSIPVKTAEEIKDLFGSGDFIHMRGEKGRDLYTMAIISSIRSNGLSIKSRG